MYPCGGERHGRGRRGLQYAAPGGGMSRSLRGRAAVGRRRRAGGRLGPRLDRRRGPAAVGKGTTFCITFCIILHNFCIIAISLCKSLGGPSEGSEASRFLPPILHNHYAKLCKVMQNICIIIMQSYAKLCNVMQSYAKLCKAKIC